MAENKNEPGSPATPPGDGRTAVKRPHATLDLKAKEVKATEVKAESRIPGPATPSSYATAAASTAYETATKAQSATAAAASSKPASAKSAGAPNASATNIGATHTERVTTQKRGGFFSHMAASVAGAILALAGAAWLLPQLDIAGANSTIADTTTALAARVQVLEKKSPDANIAPAMTAAEARLAALEKSIAGIAEIKVSQSRLIAETKAALAAAASDAGEPEQLTRLATVEEKLKALADAGANDPNAGRLPQLAALTGKVTDLETSLATQLTALRKSVADDVEARLQTATEAGEAAKSGTQRIDRDVATVKSDVARIEERLLAIKTESDRLAATVKLSEENSAALKYDLDTVKSKSVKSADVAVALAHINQKISNLDQNLQTVAKTENERRATSERVLLAIELQNFKRAVNSGRAFPEELASVRKAAGDKFEFARLTKFAEQGVPASGELAKEFRKTAYDAIDAETEAAEGGVVDRLIAGAKSVVRVRKINHTPDDKSVEAIVGRMQIALNDGRLADVISEAQDLSPKAQAAAKPFLDKVAARVSIDSTVASIETQLKSSLSPAPASSPAVQP